MSQEGLLLHLMDFIVANIWWVFWSTAEGGWLGKMSLTISIRRGKGRLIHAYSTLHWLKSINKRTTQ